MECHKKITPKIVSDWEESKHSKSGIECLVCHSDKHKAAKDFNKAQIPTPETCSQCHEKRFKEFKKGKHSFGWSSMKAMPTSFMQPKELMDGMKGCGGCHKIGLKTKDEIKQLRKEGNYGVASCNSCHTRHVFSVKEASQPQACKTCHMGFDHPQWEMYSTSKHGVRYLLKQNKILSENVAAPKCQTCHMKDGTHAVRTAWGFLGIRLPLPKDKQWANDRTTILKALGAFDPNGKPTERFEVFKRDDFLRLTEEDWQNERNKMLNICNQCHSRNFAKLELEKGDRIIREADKLMAEAINVVSSLYKDKIITPPRYYKFAFPDLLSFHDAPTVIEQKLFIMFSEHRMRTFQGTFHMNPDYAFWYGWSEMKQKLAEIKKAEKDYTSHRNKHRF